jgi:hypothetical protein
MLAATMRRIEGTGQRFAVVDRRRTAGRAGSVAGRQHPVARGGVQGCHVRLPCRGKSPTARKCRWNGHNFTDPGFLAMAALNGILEPPGDDRNTLAGRAGSGAGSGSWDRRLCRDILSR